MKIRARCATRRASDFAQAMGSRTRHCKVGCTSMRLLLLLSLLISGAADARRMWVAQKRRTFVSLWSLPRRLLCDEHTSRGLHGFTMTLARGAHGWFIVRMDVLNPPVKRLWLYQRWRRAKGAPV